MPKVRFLNELVTVEVPPQATLRDVAIQQGIEIYRGMWTHINCRGNGICGRCRVWVVASKDNASSLSVRERFHRVKGKMRLACQVRIRGDMDIRTRPIGPAVAWETKTPDTLPAPSYREAAKQRYSEAKEAEQKVAEKKAQDAAYPGTEEGAPKGKMSLNSEVEAIGKKFSPLVTDLAPGADAVNKPA